MYCGEVDVNFYGTQTFYTWDLLYHRVVGTATLTAGFMKGWSKSKISAWGMYVAEPAFSGTASGSI